MKQRNGYGLGLVIIISIIATFWTTVEAEENKELSLSERMMRLEIKVEEGFKSVNQRFEDINQRFEDINRRIDSLTNIMLGGFGVIFAGIFTLIGFVIWDRRSVVTPVARELKEVVKQEELMAREIKEVVKREKLITETLKRYAQKEPMMAEVMKLSGMPT